MHTTAWALAALKTFRTAVGPLWLQVVTGLFGAFAASYGYARDYLSSFEVKLPDIPSLAFWVALLGFIACRLLEYSTRLRKSLDPKIEVSIDGADERGMCLFPCTDGSFSKYAQLSVTPATQAPLRNCEVRLQSVERISDGKQLVEEHIHCIWSNKTDELKLTIHPLIKQRANLLHVNDKDEFFVSLDVMPIKVRLPLEIQKLDDYRVVVAITAHDVPTHVASFVFHWGGFDDMSFRQAS